MHFGILKYDLFSAMDLLRVVVYSLALWLGLAQGIPSGAYHAQSLQNALPDCAPEINEIVQYKTVTQTVSQSLTITILGYLPPPWRHGYHTYRVTSCCSFALLCCLFQPVVAYLGSVGYISKPSIKVLLERVRSYFSYVLQPVWQCIVQSLRLSSSGVLYYCSVPVV